jgi:hypothetical protein
MEYVPERIPTMTLFDIGSGLGVMFDTTGRYLVARSPM